jgi:ABC-2 type transport system permease protein
MPPAAYLAARCVTAICFGAIILTLLSILGIAFGHVHLSLAEYTHMLALVAAGAIPFASMGLALALIVPFNSAPGVTNLMYLPMSFLGGLWIPLTALPKAVQHIAPLLPTYHLAQLMLGVFGAADPKKTVASHWLGLLGFTMLMFGVAWIAFRRREQNA